MSRFLLIAIFIFVGSLLLPETKPKIICDSLSDCEKKSDDTQIHRKKITFLSNGITQYSHGAATQNLLPLYLKRARATILEANGDTGYQGEVVLKVSHKPEYKQSQLLKAEEDLRFIELNQTSLSKKELSEFLELKALLGQSK
ncbi:hypothetical protein [Leptospira terpstrae]|uniref:Uncharacterized protein n=1 Tax=Leptospira terpstrae serovar Hualin str. LT 11-33 = ATCC 700639 TaxID=1257025 RepID=N1VRQ4_9LEPT|nr:hypothetical protein [Leptospira terpstrae]EMY59690.1 hypothetical protein LEP1GSC203_0217 [Leptospira terpstrae serovar Hualin str. LT 11-33 = ATCC 700639]